MAAPSFWDDPASAQAHIARKNAVEAVLAPFDALAAEIEDARALHDLLSDEGVADDAAECTELADALSRAEESAERFELQSLLSGRFDAANAYLTLHAGAGGTEACDWVAMLERMYERFCQSRGWTCELLDALPGDEAGLKSASLYVAGPFAYGYLKAERGVHRLVRISPFDAAKRRHTTFAALDVVAELDDDVDVEVKESDLKIDTYRSSGAGGQHVNKTDSAIRITHIPTGIVVACQAERSQHANRNRAMKMLKAKIYELEQDKKRAALDRFYGEKGSIGWGNQIRSYVLQPYTMAKDHRTGCENGNVQAVLDGALDPFVAAYLKKAKTGEIASPGAAGEEEP